MLHFLPSQDEKKQLLSKNVAKRPVTNIVSYVSLGLHVVWIALFVVVFMHHDKHTHVRNLVEVSANNDSSWWTYDEKSKTLTIHANIVKIGQTNGLNSKRLLKATSTSKLVIHGAIESSSVNVANNILFHGLPIETSIQGPKGDTGAQGATGTKGDTGPQGATGTKGDIGPQGAPGANGATGAQGAPGTKGDTGAQGTTGAKGEKGDTGDAVGSANGVDEFAEKEIRKLQSKLKNISMTGVILYSVLLAFILIIGVYSFTKGRKIRKLEEHIATGELGDTVSAFQPLIVKDLNFDI